MEIGFTSFAESQDLFATLTHQQFDVGVGTEPWNLEFKCGAVSFDPVSSPVRLSSSSLSSRGLPSLRGECADFAQLGSCSFPIPLVHTTNGIDFLFGRLFKVYRRLSRSSSLADMKEFMQVLGLINFVGTDIKASNELTDQYFSLLSKFLLKLGPLSRAVSSLPVNACSQNIPFHVALFTWGTACGVLREQTESQSKDDSLLTINTAFIVLLDGLASLRDSCGSAVPCSCVQSVLLDLYRSQGSKLLECSFDMIKHLTRGGYTYSEQLKDLGKLVSTPGGFFAFFAETISHFVDIQAIVADEIMARFVLMFGMGDLLCDSELLTTCKVLLSFIHKCNLKGFAKIRRFATKFITKILQTVDALDIPELDKLGRGKPTHWAENILSSFKYCTAEETSLIVFLTRLLSDEQLSSCRSIVINRYSGVKLLVSGCVLSSMLSMLLSLVAGINDSRELATKICEWISAAIPNASESQCNIFFNALDVLASLTCRENAGNTVNVHSTVVNCLNFLRLPERSSVFTSKFLAMAKTHPSQLIGIDVSRFVNAASKSDLTAFIHLMADVDVEIGGNLWDKAAASYVAKPSDEKLREFVVNQLCVGMRNSSPQAMVRFKSTVEKIVSAQPAAELLFSFCNGVLSRLSEKQTHIAVQLVPLWIFAVLAFSTSREMETKRFTSLIWDHILRQLNNISPSCPTIELSPGNSEAFAIRFFEILGSGVVPSSSVNKIVAESIPFAMANNITNLLKSDDNDMLERVIRVCNVMLSNIGSTLLTIAEAEAQRTGLNRTAFVVISQALVTKMVKGSMSVEFLQQSVPVYISALAKLPYRIFIYSRIKDLLVKFQQEAAIASSISGVLDQLKESAHYKQLLKDSDPRVKNFLANQA